MAAEPLTLCFLVSFHFPITTSLLLERKGAESHFVSVKYRGHLGGRAHDGPVGWNIQGKKRKGSRNRVIPGSTENSESPGSPRRW